MHPRQASLLTEIDRIDPEINKQAGGLYLWRYVDPDGMVFFLTERRMTVRSPYTGKSFSSKPQKVTAPQIAKDLKEHSSGWGLEPEDPWKVDE